MALPECALQVGTRAKPCPQGPCHPACCARPPACPAAEGGVAGTRKYSAGKAGGGLLVAGVAATAAAAPLLGLDPWSLASIETGFLLATSASLAGA